MSVRVMADVWDLDLPQNEKIILLKFADHANDEGLDCFPSLERIAHYSGCSRRTVQRLVRKLEDRGVLEVLGGGEGRGDPRRYRVRPEKGDRLTPFREERATAHARKVDRAMSTEPSREPSKKNSSSSEPTLSIPGIESTNGGPPEASRDDFEKLWAAARRGSKKKAWEQYRKAIPKKVDAKTLGEAWLRIVAAAEEEQFIPHFFRWIRDERWEEDVPERREDEPEVGSDAWAKKEYERIMSL